MLLAPSAISFAPRPPVAARLPAGAALPKLIVFDLDNTLWTPELYQVARRVKAAPVAGRDVKLFPAAAAALHEIDTCDRWEGTQIAVASRTNQGDWARTLLDAFEVPGDPSRRLSDLVAYQEIYTGNKRAHFESLRRRSGLPFGSMLFFDDARGGRFGNCEPVARMGVLSAHCPNGLTDGVWAHAVRSYAALAADEAWMGMVVPASGGAPESPDEASASASAAAREESNGGPHDATVVRWLEGKSFGFVRRVSGGGDLFAHASALPPGAPTPQKGDAVSVLVGVDRGGRVACTSVTPTGGPGPSEGGSITLPCFSMNMPFAGLVAHGRKTLETRNGTMFERATGLCLLHVGRRTYPDGGKHRAILAEAGDSEEEIGRTTALPPGFSRGGVVALLELGDTRPASLEERSTAEVQSAACALGSDMGRYLTEVKRASFLKAPVAMRGQPGMFSATVPRAALPDGWEVVVGEEGASRAAAQAVGAPREGPRVRQTYG